MMINYGYSFQINIFFKKEGLFNRRRVSSSIFLSNDMFYSNKMGIGMNYKFFSTEADSGRGKEGLVNVRDKDFVSLREGNSNFFNTKRNVGGTGYNSYKYNWKLGNVCELLDDNVLSEKFKLIVEVTYLVILQFALIFNFRNIAICL